MRFLRETPFLGHAVVVVSATTFAGNNVFAGLAFEGGASPLTLVAARTVFAAAALAVLLRLTGGEISLPRRERRVAAGLGLLNGAMAFLLMSAFDLIAVGLAVLIFYLYPVLTGILAWVVGQDRIDRGLAFALVGGFGGLVLALEYSGEGDDLLGMALAAAAALLMAVTIVVSVRVLRSGNSRAVTLHMQGSSAVMFAVALAAFGEVSLPGTSAGWAASAAVLLLYTVAIASFFAGVARAGGARAALLMNLEPVASIALGFALLGQALTPRQLVGAAVVLAAVSAVKWLKAR